MNYDGLQPRTDRESGIVRDETLYRDWSEEMALSWLVLQIFVT